MHSRNTSIRTMIIKMFYYVDIMTNFDEEFIVVINSMHSPSLELYICRFILQQVSIRKYCIACIISYERAQNVVNLSWMYNYSGNMFWWSVCFLLRLHFFFANYTIVNTVLCIKPCVTQWLVTLGTTIIYSLLELHCFNVNKSAHLEVLNTNLQLNHCKC